MEGERDKRRRRMGNAELSRSAQRTPVAANNIIKSSTDSQRPRRIA